MKRESRRILATLGALALLTTLAACSQGDADADSADAKAEAHGDDHEDESGNAEEGEGEHGETAPEAVLLSPEQRAAAGIEVAAAGPGAIDSGTELLGEVHPNGDRLAHIVPRFPGIVREVRRNAGEHVKAGDVLAVIESSDSLAPYTLKTAIDGIVLAKHLTRGEAVDREKQAFVVADLSSVWVDLSVYQKDLGRITMGQRVRIHAVNEGPDAEGAISYLTPAVDQVTRTATARVVLENPEREFLPGMFVTAHTLDAAEAAVVVPRDAIQTFEGRTVVFVESEGGFTPRPVTLGREGETRAEVLTGLSAGEPVAVANTFLLKAELAKSEAEHEH